MRKSQISRKTTETDIVLSLIVDGTGVYDVKSGSGFFDHMLEQLARHGAFDLSVRCDGDTEVDMHHSVEDIGICLGEAFREALGDKRGIRRYGSCILPMDEALVLCALDFSGRAYLGFDIVFPPEYKVGDLDTELIAEFFAAFARSACATVHFKALYGSNVHHIAEAVFKSFGRALREACSVDAARADVLPSTKGTL